MMTSQCAVQHKQRCSALRSQSAAVPAPARAPFRVCAQKKVVKRQQVIWQPLAVTYTILAQIEDPLYVNTALSTDSVGTRAGADRMHVLAAGDPVEGHPGNGVQRRAGAREQRLPAELPDAAAACGARHSRHPPVRLLMLAAPPAILEQT
jgi:hypothetical protein